RRRSPRRCSAPPGCRRWSAAWTSPIRSVPSPPPSCPRRPTGRCRAARAPRRPPGRRCATRAAFPARSFSCSNSAPHAQHGLPRPRCLVTLCLVSLCLVSVCLVSACLVSACLVSACLVSLGPVGGGPLDAAVRGVQPPDHGVEPEEFGVHH